MISAALRSLCAVYPHEGHANVLSESATVLILNPSDNTCSISDLTIPALLIPLAYGENASGSILPPYFVVAVA